MLEVFRDFEIRGDPSKLTTFLSQLVKALPRTWKRDVNREKELRDLSGSGRHFALKVGADGDRPNVFLFLYREGHTLKVTNVVPVEYGELSRQQYNSVIEDLSQIAVPIADKLSLEAIATTGQLDIREILSPRAFQALRGFSAGANKTTGSSHPMDRRRWISFLILQHTEARRLDPDILIRWLIEEDGWPETEAHDLGSEFEFARELLSSYDHDRA